MLFRPLHERFWWGNTGATANNHYPALWRQMFNYMTNDRELDNLLWVFSPEGTRYPYPINKYPGDSYVDIVAMDIYDNYIASPRAIYISNYNDLRATGKPFAFGEFGPRSNDANNYTPFDFANFLDSLKQNFPDTIFFQTWHTRWGLANPVHSGADTLLNDSWIINRDDISF